MHTATALQPFEAMRRPLPSARAGVEVAFVARAVAPADVSVAER